MSQNKKIILSIFLVFFFVAVGLWGILFYFQSIRKASPPAQKLTAQKPAAKTPTATLNIDAKISTDKEKKMVIQAGDALQDVCPLLGVYSEDIASAKAVIKKVNKDMMDGEYHARGWKNYVEFEVVVKNPISIIPQAYYAAGHHCTFRVGSDKAVHTAKQPCAKICKGSGINAKGLIWFWIKQ